MGRTNSTVAGAGGSLDGFDRVTEDGVEYLVHDVVAQKEGVYSYPDPSGGIRREFVSADELSSSIEGKDAVDVVVSHPETPDGSPTLMGDPRANFTEVGSWKELRETKNGDGIAGKVYIRANEVGEHDGELQRYLKFVRQHGIGEVSTGYDIEQAIPNPGRFNGIQYGYEQRGIMLDHLALLPNEQGDCSIEDGCGLGRANQSDDAPIRVNHHVPTDDAEIAEELGDLEESGRLNVLIEFIESKFNRLTEDPATMQDTDRIDELVEEYGFTRENLSPLEGTTCLTRIHESVVDHDGEDDSDKMGDTPEDGDGDDVVFTDAQEDRLNEMFEENVPSADDIAERVNATATEGGDSDGSDEPEGAEAPDVDSIAEQVLERVEESRTHQQNVDLVAQSDEFPNIDEEKAERMNSDVLSDLAESAKDAESDGESRANYAGRPSGSSFDEADYDGDDFDIPVAGAGPDTGGDD